LPSSATYAHLRFSSFAVADVDTDNTHRVWMRRRGKGKERVIVAS